MIKIFLTSTEGDTKMAIFVLSAMFVLQLLIVIDIIEFQQGFTENLPKIYSKFTQNKAIFGVYLLKTYPTFTQSLLTWFTQDLPRIYLRVTKYIPQKVLLLAFCLLKTYPAFIHNLGIRFFYGYILNIYNI